MLPRVIPVILVEDGRAIHTVSFRYNLYLGDPINIARIFSDLAADEIVVLDRSRKETFLEAGNIEHLSRQINVPLSYGGGLHSRKSVTAAFSAGADRVVFRATCHECADLVPWTVAQFGSQSVTVCFNLNEPTKHRFLRKSPGLNDSIELAHNFVSQGAGELLFQDVKRSGKQEGPDFDSLGFLGSLFSTSVILSGGVYSITDIRKAVQFGFSGVAVSSKFSREASSGSPLVSYLSEEERKQLHP